MLDIAICKMSKDLKALLFCFFCLVFFSCQLIMTTSNQLVSSSILIDSSYLQTQILGLLEICLEFMLRNTSYQKGFAAGMNENFNSSQ